MQRVNRRQDQAAREAAKSETLSAVESIASVSGSFGRDGSIARRSGSRWINELENRIKLIILSRTALASSTPATPAACAETTCETPTPAATRTTSLPGSAG